jgi:prepilin-type N-terminal cleavage/methylation domain-containing protein
MRRIINTLNKNFINFVAIGNFPRNPRWAIAPKPQNFCIKQQHTMKNRKNKRNRKGFSLVELLVVIAVIGVIAAVAIPAVSGVFGESETAKAKRNAQQIAQVFKGAQAAGNTTDYATKSAAITAVTQGTGLAGRGAFSSNMFRAPMSTTEATLAEPYLSYSPTAKTLNYVADGGETTGNNQAEAQNTPPPNQNPWYLLIIIPTVQAPAYVANLNVQHVGNNHKHEPLAGGNSGIYWQSKN